MVAPAVARHRLLRMRLAPLAFALAVAAVAAWRWARLGWPLRRFVALAGAGTGLWSAAFVLLGYLFWHSLDEALAIAKHTSLILGAAVALVIAVVAGYPAWPRP